MAVQTHNSKRNRHSGLTFLLPVSVSFDGVKAPLGHGLWIVLWPLVLFVCY